MTLSTSAVAVCCCSDSRQIVGARLHFVEQPRILDGDDRLIGEGAQQFDRAYRRTRRPRWRVTLIAADNGDAVA